MANMEKDKEQDKRLDYIDAELIDIKSVTHGSEIHQWNGIVKEHNKLTGTVGQLKENSDFITKIFRSFLGLLRLTGIMIGLITGGWAVFKIFF